MLWTKHMYVYKFITLLAQLYVTLNTQMAWHGLGKLFIYTAGETVDREPDPATGVRIWDKAREQRNINSPGLGQPWTVSTHSDDDWGQQTLKFYTYQ